MQSIEAITQKDVAYIIFKEEKKAMLLQKICLLN